MFRGFVKKDDDCSSQLDNDSGDCDEDNEVTRHSKQIENSLERDTIHPHPIRRNKENIEPYKELAEMEREREDEYVRTDTGAKFSAVTETATIENATCGYQNNSSAEDDEDEAKSTLIDYPFSVSIQKKGAHYVSGALIDKRWILSVAAEFYNVRDTLKLFRARLGSVDCKRGGSLVPIKRVEIHPYYIYGKPNFDVALLRMAIPVDYSEVLRPIGISNINGKVLSAKFMTTYWPRIVLNGKTLPKTAKERIKYNSMRVSTQRLIPIDKCKNIMAAIKEYINESSLCLKPVVTHHSVCMPDAGAPVVAEDGLWGITSGWISPSCPNLAAPTIFTRLSSPSVRSWLDTQLLNL
uniref:Peptidase S1 domain-containing protein n=1 Tax=Heliothis virescens TaxID=7102 RepID=A0A2A4JYQ1_HELVI